ncbi:MAG: hypothetical protein JST86_16685 [Bacteroidetes bacterium]|nr:hypothetical protein [Bacteroidota bacterium]
MYQRILFALCILLYCSRGNAQVRMNRDSLMQLLPAAKDDSTKVLLLINIGQQFEDQNPALAKFYYQSAGALSRKINYTLGVIKFIANYTYVLNGEGAYDSSLQLNLESVALSRKINDSGYIAKTLFNTGTSYNFKNDYERAVAFYTEAQAIFKKEGNEAIEAEANEILQVLYFNMHQNAKGIECGKKAIAYARKNGDSILLSQALMNLGVNLSAASFDSEALQQFKESMQIGKRIGNDRVVMTALLNIGDNYLQRGEYAAMKDCFIQSLHYAKQMNSDIDKMLSYKGLAFYYFSIKDYTRAKQYGDSSLALTQQNHYRDDEAKLYTFFSNLAYAQQDMRLGEQFARRSRLLADSLLNESIAHKTQEMETKLETRIKQNKIDELESAKKVQQLTIERKNIFNGVLIGTAILMLLMGLLLFRNFRQKQKLQQQRINELETEKKLTATEAVLKGEEQERTRLAKDLHDSLGGMLSGIKYSMNSMKGNLILTPETAQAFERSMDMLDSSIKEMRRVAHNMMPEALVKFGLDTALKDFCNDINQSGALKVTYQSIGVSNTAIDQTAAITIYRIVQELINNTMKHAAAKSAIVQVSKTNGQISVTVEDDGKGFDPVILQSAKGIGWTNIQSRIDFLKGTLDVQSAPGKGTSVHIELNA